ncbi:transmembrane protein, putative [Medicago truncatula]|uniref:Transmembrane protein, putative n=1 Tax=Medicago truncatula TaxID=3880 RepID=A0A072UWV8_MEDTR|nr:transmembrane protein, putative [Medicago truncatula]
MYFSELLGSRSASLHYPPWLHPYPHGDRPRIPKWGSSRMEFHLRMQISCLIIIFVLFLEGFSALIQQVEHPGRTAWNQNLSWGTLYYSHFICISLSFIFQVDEHPQGLSEFRAISLIGCYTQLYIDEGQSAPMWNSTSSSVPVVESTYRYDISDVVWNKYAPLKHLISQSTLVNSSLSRPDDSFLSPYSI